MMSAQLRVTCAGFSIKIHDMLKVPIIPGSISYKCSHESWLLLLFAVVFALTSLMSVSLIPSAVYN